MSFRDAIRSKEFVVTAELPLTPATTRESLISDAEMLRDSVDGFLLTDNQYGQPHMAPSYAAGILQAKGFPPVLQISCRNRNRIALMGEVIGAKATGIDTVVLVNGAILPEGYSPRPNAVMDTDAKDLIATAKLINADDSLGHGEELLIGTSATVHIPPADTTPVELIAKADAGAQLVVTQICLRMDVLRRYMEYLVAHKLVQRFSVVVSVAVVASNELAGWLKDNRRGTIIPDDHIERLVAAGTDDAGVIEYTAALVREIHDMPGATGVNFAVAGDLHLIPEVIAASGISG